MSKTRNNLSRLTSRDSCDSAGDAASPASSGRTCRPLGPSKTKRPDNSAHPRPKKRAEWESLGIFDIFGDIPGAGAQCRWCRSFERPTIHPKWKSGVDRFHAAQDPAGRFYSTAFWARPEIKSKSKSAAFFVSGGNIFSAVEVKFAIPGLWESNCTTPSMKTRKLFCGFRTRVWRAVWNAKKSVVLS